jgi:uncharacterized membrane protein
MGQDPNQPYPGQYGQPGGVPPQQEAYSGYQQANPYQQPNAYQQPPNTGYQYQQQNYGQPAPGMMYNMGSPNGPTTMNMDPNVAGGLSYILGWITGLIFFLVEKQNRFVRFNAMQSILLSVVWIVGGWILDVIPYVGGVLGLLFGIAGFIIWIICLVNGFQGKYFKLPLIGDYAERWANPGPAMPRM